MVFVETSLSACPGTRHYQVGICLSAMCSFQASLPVRCVPSFSLLPVPSLRYKLFCSARSCKTCHKAVCPPHPDSWTCLGTSPVYHNHVPQQPWAPGPHRDGADGGTGGQKPAGRVSLLKSATKFICAMPNTCYYRSKAINLLTLHFSAK